jgi:hypothetical protein
MKSLQVPPLNHPPPVPILLLLFNINNKNNSLAEVLDVEWRAKHGPNNIGNFCSKISCMFELRDLDLLKFFQNYPKLV